MRTLVAIPILLSVGTAVQAREHYKPMPSMSWNAAERLKEKLIKNPPRISRERLPKYFELGRCLLVVRGRTYISGPCAYSTTKGGEFEAHGPHQVFSGVDYPRPEGYSEEISTDYWFDIQHELSDGGKTGAGWTASWNEDKLATHAQTYLGNVTKRGACFTNSDVKACLWKK